MKASPLLITWHNENQAIYSVHFDPNGKGRLATAGLDSNVRLWSIEANGEERKVTYLSTLSRHSQPVNVVRFSPKGEILASAGDDGNILLWVPSDLPPTTQLGGEDHSEDKETWRHKHMIRTPTGAEIYDLAWSPDGVYFITGGMDNTARIYNAQTGAMIRQIAEHSHYVQGVAWDPLNEFVATQSSDRSVHIYALKLKDGTFTLSTHGKFNKIDLPGRRISANSQAILGGGGGGGPTEPGHRASTSAASATSVANASIASPAPSVSNPGTPLSTPLPMDPPPTLAHSHSRRSSFGSSPSFGRSASPAPSLPLPAVRPEISSPSLSAAMGLAVRNTSLYQNETLNSFFRRLTFTPDGSLLFTPAGQHKTSYAMHADPPKTSEQTQNTVYIYTRAGFNKPPVCHLPGHKKPSVAVKCSPIFYTLRQGIKPTSQITIDTASGAEEIPLLPESVVTPNASSTFMEPPRLVPPSPVTAANTSNASPSPAPPPPPPTPTPAFSLPYRMVYAVATQDAVFVYDTQQTIPLCVVSNLHFAAFSDLTWSNDGLTLLMSSSDGFCSVLAFAPGELGQVYTGPHPTHTNPIVTTSISLPTSQSGTPAQTPTATASPSLTKASPVIVPPSHPSPAPTFSMRPGSPARSNSQSSIATMTSISQANNATPTLGHVPLATAINSGPPIVVPPMSTPPQTPASTQCGGGSGGGGGGLHSATSSISGSILGKRDASESEGEGSKVKKPRRIAPTLVSQDAAAPGPSSNEAKKG